MIMQIRSLNYRMQHESIPLSEEKQLLKEIKALEQTRPQVIANAAKRAEIQGSMGQKETIQGQVKVLSMFEELSFLTMEPFFFEVCSILLTMNKYFPADWR